MTLEETREAFRGSTAKARRKPPTWKTKKCERCGDEISVLWMRQKYCKACAEIVKQEKNHITTAASNEKRKAQREEARTKKPHKSQIDDIARKARAAGMSYGRYVAMLGAKKKA